MIEHPSLETATSGSIRFNTDSSKLEIYNGEAWWNIDSTSPEEQTGGTRGVIMGGLAVVNQMVKMSCNLLPFHLQVIRQTLVI